MAAFLCRWLDDFADTGDDGFFIGATLDNGVARIELGGGQLGER